MIASDSAFEDRMRDFFSIFGTKPGVSAQAPGRVNLIGEHTDYNGGFVLPTAIPQQTCVDLAPREDDKIRVQSRSITTSSDPASYRLGKETPRHDWLDYVQGVTALLSKQGHRLHGFDALVNSNIPLGSGLSSSASLTVALMRALRIAFNLVLDDLEIARL